MSLLLLLLLWLLFALVLTVVVATAAAHEDVVVHVVVPSFVRLFAGLLVGMVLCPPRAWFFFVCLVLLWLPFVVFACSCLSLLLLHVLCLLKTQQPLLTSIRGSRWLPASRPLAPFPTSKRLRSTTFLLLVSLFRVVFDM